MSAISLIVLVAAALATALGGAALYTARGLHRQLTALRSQLDAAEAAREATAAESAVPAARRTPAEEIRTAVAEALAEERERELTEARAFWAAQEARDADADTGSLLAGHGTEYEVVAPDIDSMLLDALLEGRLDGLEGLHGPASGGDVFIPRQADDEEPPGAGEDDTEAGLNGDRERGLGADLDLDGGREPEPDLERERGLGPEPESAELAAARRRHPSHPDFTLTGDPVLPPPALGGAAIPADHERTVQRLAQLADTATPLADIRSGPLGTLDVYVFEDGTTLCMSPGHRETAQQLTEALDAGLPPVLLGGSGVSGAYSLTFTVGEQRVYTLADRVIASL